MIDAADRELTFAQLNAAFCSNDVILAEENAFSDGETPDNSPGAVWKLRPGMMGKVQRLGNLSSTQVSQFNNHTLWQNLMEQTTGNFEVNQGKEPARVTTASGIALMNERAKSRQTLKKAGRTEGFKRLYSLIDYTALEFYEKGRFVERGADGFEFDPDSYRSGELSGAFPAVDIRIHVGDGLNNSKAFTVSAVSSLIGTAITEDNYKFVKAYVDLIGLPMRNEICEYLENKFSPAKNPPVQIIPMTQQTIRERIGITMSFTPPFPTVTSSLPSPYGRSGVVNRSPFFALSSCTFIEPKSMFRIAIVTIITIVSNA